MEQRNMALWNYFDEWEWCVLCREPEHRAVEPKKFNFVQWCMVVVVLVVRTNGSVLWFCDAIPKLYALIEEMTDFNRFMNAWCMCMYGYYVSKSDKHNQWV